MAKEEAAHNNTEAAEEVKPEQIYDNTEGGEVKSEEVPAEEKKEEVEEEKAAGEEGGNDVVPDKYDIKLPDETLLDEKDVERIAARAKELGLTADEAQELADLEEETRAIYQKKQLEDFESTTKQWRKEAETDKEIGGAKFKENLENAKRVIDKFGTKEFKEFLDNSGFGNHKEVVRVFSRISKQMAEDQLVIGGAKLPGEKSAEQILYPTTTE